MPQDFAHVVTRFAANPVVPMHIDIKWCHGLAGYMLLGRYRRHTMVQEALTFVKLVWLYISVLPHYVDCVYVTRAIGLRMHSIRTQGSHTRYVSAHNGPL